MRIPVSDPSNSKFDPNGIKKVEELYAFAKGEANQHTYAAVESVNHYINSKLFGIRRPRESSFSIEHGYSTLEVYYSHRKKALNIWGSSASGSSVLVSPVIHKKDLTTVQAQQIIRGFYNTANVRALKKELRAARSDASLTHTGKAASPKT